jgi:hypothetical protein
LLSLRFGLGAGIIAFAVLRPVKREPISHQSVSDICPSDRADTNDSLVSITIHLDAVQGTTINVVKQSIRCPLSTAIKFAFLVATELIGFGSIDSVYANSSAMYFDGIAVDNRCLTD